LTILLQNILETSALGKLSREKAFQRSDPLFAAIELSTDLCVPSVQRAAHVSATGLTGTRARAGGLHLSHPAYASPGSKEKSPTTYLTFSNAGRPELPRAGLDHNRAFPGRCMDSSFRAVRRGLYLLLLLLLLLQVARRACSTDRSLVACARRDR